MGALLLVRAASADEFSFSAPVTGAGNWLFEGPLNVHDGKFQEYFTSGNARLQVWGTVEGDHISIGGQVKVTGFYEQASAFSIDGKFRGDKFTGNFVETLNYGQNLHGQITMTRPVTQAAPAPTAPAQQAVVKPQPQPQPATTPAPETKQAAPAAPTPASLEPKLSAAQRQAVQQQLTVLGFYDHAVDGSLGPGTRAGIRKFQVAYDLAPTGYLDAKQISLLKEAAAAKEKEIAARRRSRPSSRPPPRSWPTRRRRRRRPRPIARPPTTGARRSPPSWRRTGRRSEAQKAELKRQQDELAKSQQQAEAPKTTPRGDRPGDQRAGTGDGRSGSRANAAGRERSGNATGGDCGRSTAGASRRFHRRARDAAADR